MNLALTALGTAGGLAASAYVARQWFKGGTCESTTRLDGKTVVITGANTGIGKETAIDMAKRGAVVILACRDRTRGESALKEIKERSANNDVFLKILDLSSLHSIHEFCESFLKEHDKLHILINNAGVMTCPYSKTEDGFEMQIGVNHFGHFALTNLLLERIVQSAPSRIVNVSSRAHTANNTTIKFDDINSEKNYSKFFAYSQSKLANILFTKELDRRLSGKGVTTYALHPGVVYTELSRHLSFLNILAPVAWLFFKTSAQGAQTSIYCAVEEGIESQSGMYFSDCHLTDSSHVSYDDGIAKKLWEISEEKTGVEYPL